MACFYPTYPTLDVLFKCVPLPPANLTLANLHGFPPEAKVSLSLSLYIYMYIYIGR